MQGDYLPDHVHGLPWGGGELRCLSRNSLFVPGQLGGIARRLCRSPGPLRPNPAQPRAPPTAPSVPPALTARACQGPITSTYSEVWWTGWENALPKDVVQRFDGKTIAIVGIEMDQVMKTPDGDVSVPINIACGHHSLPLPRSLALSSRVVSQRVHAQTTTITAPVS